MERIDLTSKQSKMSSYVVKHWKLRKTQNYKSNQIRINLHRFDVKTIKMLSYVAKHSKQRKTTKVVKLQWIASIWCQNGQKTQNYKRNQIRINLHRFDVKTIKNVELRRKSFKTTQNYESHQITMNCIDLMSKHQTNAKLQKWSNYDEFASIWRQNDQKSQNYKSGQITMNCIDLMSKRSKIAKLQKESNSDQFASIWVQNDQNVK